VLIGAPGNTKTETVQALVGAGAHIISTIASEGALLSASPKKRGATGGLLRKIGDHGIMVIKDVTTLLSQQRDSRAMVLAALREIYDGYWVRNVGIDGGQTLEWLGRLITIGACTTAWDTHHAVIGVMGDRWLLIRTNSNNGRTESGMQAIHNTGSETEMREELAAVVGGLVLNACCDEIVAKKENCERLVAMADIVARARTAVERDYQGNIIDAHAPEMPTRLAKQLIQIMRGGVAIGMKQEEAMRLALRCARDPAAAARNNA
jgi:hypothetical protein